MVFDLSKKEDRIAFGRRLHARRTKLGLTQAVVAHRARCTQFPVSMAERGGRTTWAREIRRVLLDAELSNRRVRQEKSRIAKMRALWAAIPTSPEKAACEQAMLDRAWTLLDTGMEGAAGCDALLEFMPEARADELLNEYFKEDVK